MKLFYLPNGKPFYFPDDWSDEQIVKAIRGMDQREVMPERGYTRVAADVVVDFGALMASFVPTALDALKADPVPEAAMTGQPLRRKLLSPPLAAVGDEFERRRIRTREVVAGFAGGLESRLEQLQAEAGSAVDVGLAATGSPAAHALSAMGGAGALAAGARKIKSLVGGDLAELRAEENRKRIAENRPTLEEEAEDQYLTRSARDVGEFIDKARDALKSDYSRAIEGEFAKAQQEGIGSTVEFLAENPLQSASVMAGPALAYLAPALLSARLARAAGASDAAATTAAVQGTGGVIALHGAEQAEESVMSADMSGNPKYLALIEKDYSDEQARRSLAKEAYDAALGTGAVVNAATGAVAQRLGLAQVEEMLATGGRKVGVGRIAGAAGAGIKEAPGEAIQGAGEKYAANVGEIAAGIRSPSDVLEGIGTSAVVEAFGGATIGAAVGFASPQRVAEEVTGKPANQADPLTQAAQDVSAIYEAARSGQFDDVGKQGQPEETRAPIAAAEPIAAPPIAQESVQATAAQTQQSVPPVDDLEAMLQSAGAEPIIAPSASPEHAAAFEAYQRERAAQVERSAAPADRVRNPMPDAMGRATELPPIKPAGDIAQPIATPPQDVISAVSENPGRISFKDNEAVARAKLEKTFLDFGVDPHLAKTMSESDTIPTGAIRDGVTGGFDGRADSVKSGLIARAIEHVANTMEPSHYVSVDIANLGGLNKFNNDIADDANADFRALTDIMLGELRSTGADVLPMRTGGDELGYIVVNAKKEDVDAAIEMASAKALEYAKARGFDSIPSTKKGREGEFGVRFHAGVAEIVPGISVREIARRADQGINASKLGVQASVAREQTQEAGAIAPVQEPERLAGAGAERNERVRQKGVRSEGQAPAASEAQPEAPVGRADSGADEGISDQGDASVNDAGDQLPQAAERGERRTESPAEVAGEPSSEGTIPFSRQSRTTAAGSADRQPSTLDTPATRAIQALIERVGYPSDRVVFSTSPNAAFGDDAAAAMGLDGKTEAIYFNGKVYLFTDALPDPARAVWVFAHEMSGHHGLRTLLGDNYAKMMNEAGSNPLIKAIAEAIKAEADTEAESGAAGARVGLDPTLYIEEALVEYASAKLTGDMDSLYDRYPDALMAEPSVAKAESLIKRIVRAITRKTYNSGVRMTDAEVLALIANAHRASIGIAPSDGRSSRAKQREPNAAQSRSQAPDDERRAARRVQSRATDSARLTAAALRKRKSQLSRELVTQSASIEQMRAWSMRARMLIGEVSSSLDFAKDIIDARRELTAERRELLKGDREALRRYDDIRDLLALLEQKKREVRDKAVEANKILDRFERKYEGGVSGKALSLADREAVVAQLRESLDSAEQAFIAAKRIADWRSQNDAKVIKAHNRRNDILGYLASEGYQMGSFTWDGAESIKDKAASIRRRIRRVIQDKMIDVRDVQFEIERQLGRALDDTQNVYREENLMHGKIADSVDMFRQKMADPLKSLIKESGMPMEVVEKYLWAAHAKERNAKIRAINPGVDDGSGMSDGDADKVLASYSREQKEKLRPISEAVEGIRRHTLNTLVDAGQLTRDQADKIISSYGAYVPLRGKHGEGEARVGGTGQGISAAGAGIKRALGRKTPPKNILAELVGDAERAIVQAGKADVGRALLRLALSYPNPDLWAVEPVELEPKFNESTGEVYLAVSGADDSESVIVKHNGKPYRVAIKHPQIVAALRNTGVEGWHNVVKYGGMLNRWLSAVFTRYNPGFVPVNLARDMFLGLTGIAAELGPGSAGAVIGNYRQAVAATYLDSRMKRGDASVADDKKTMADWVREGAESGLKTGWTSLDDMDTLQSKIENSMLSLSEIAAKRPLDVFGEAVRRSAVFTEIDHVNDAIENALRFATYAHLRKDKGWSKARAAEYAKEMTVNFNRKGMAGSIINALYLFFNAGVQGSARTLKIMQNPKVLAGLGGLLAGQATLAMTLGAVKFDEDDEETLWDKIPDWAKRRSFIIPYGFDEDGTARWFSIPMPFGFNVFPAAGGYLANFSNPAWRGRNESPVANATGYLLSSVIDSLSPIAIGEENGMLPTLLQIDAAIGQNRDDLGRRIRPSEESQKYERARSSQVMPGTPEPFVWGAKILNRLGGGTDYKKPVVLTGWTDVSPNDLEFLFNQFAGGPGNVISGAYRAAMRDVAADDMRAFDLPVVRAVVGGARKESSEVRRFYETSDRIERAKDMLGDAYAAGGIESYLDVKEDLGPAFQSIDLKVRKRTTANGRAGAIMVDPSTGRPEFVSPDGSLLDQYRDASKTLREISAAMRQIYNDPSLDRIEKQRRMIDLQKIRGDAVERVNRTMAAYDAERGGAD